MRDHNVGLVGFLLQVQVNIMNIHEHILLHVIRILTVVGQVVFPQLSLLESHTIKCVQEYSSYPQWEVLFAVLL